VKGRTPQGLSHYQAAKTHCPYGHPYSDANTLLTRERRRDGVEWIARRCKACRAARHKRWRESRQ
jgi:hypothetical protein